MKKLLQKLIMPILAVMALALPVAAVAVTPVYAQDCDNGVGKGIGLTNEDGSCADDDAEGGFGALVKRVINIFSIVVGAVSVIMIIIGGFRYVVSGGDSGGVSGAKNTILYAIVGLIIVLFAQVIVRFVFSNATQQ